MRRTVLGLVLVLTACDDPVSISPRAQLVGEWVYSMELGLSIGLSCTTAGHVIVRPADAGPGTLERFEPGHYGCHVLDGDVTSTVVDSVGGFTMTTPNCTLTGQFVTADSLAGTLSCLISAPRTGTWAAGRAGAAASLDIGPPVRVAAVGTLFELAALVRDADGRRLMGLAPEWSSLNASIATVTAQNDSAEVTALAVGSATLRARYHGMEATTLLQVASPTFTEISAGARHTCGLTAGGEVWCWGANHHGQLGDGARRGEALGPVRVAGDLKFSTVSANSHHACGVSAAAIYCWGFNGAGQLGVGDTISRGSPTRVQGNTAWAQVSIGTSHTCAVDAEDSAWCWGAQHAGRSVGTDGADRLRPGRVITSTPFNRVGAGGDHSCALTLAGAAYCWGSYSAALGAGSVTQGDTLPVPVSGNHTFAALSVASLRTCAIAASGSPYCWGLRVPSSGPVVDSIARVPELEVEGRTFSAISTAFGFTCGIDAADGAALCWGSNYLGQLGNGTTSFASPPVAVAGGLAFTRLSVGWSHVCGIATNGATYCWGLNDVGQLGDGTTTDRHVPMKVVGQP